MQINSFYSFASPSASPGLRKKFWLSLSFGALTSVSSMLMADEVSPVEPQGRVSIRLQLHPATSAAVQSAPPAGRAGGRVPLPVQNSQPLSLPRPDKTATADDATRLVQFDGPLELTDSAGPKKIPATAVARELTAPAAEAEDAQSAEDTDSGGQQTSPAQPTKIKSSPLLLKLTDKDGQLELKSLQLSDGEGGLQECPGSPASNLPEQAPQADDIPLEQNEHPYDAPSSQSMRELTVEDISSAPSAIPLTARELRIKEEIRRCLAYYISHPENTTRRGPWALMHATLPFGVETEIIAGNQRVNAIGWMCFNGACAKQRLFQPTRQGFRTNVGPGVQGHEGQFLAILAQSSVRGDYPLQVGNRRYSVMDLCKYEMATCREQSELTFKLIGLSHYLPPTQRWRDDRGHTWDLEKMVGEELAQPVVGAACGGTHRLMGLSYALVRRQAAGLPIDGHWLRAEQYLNDYVNYAMSLQNPDGSFSTDWFEARAMDPDVERKVQTSGHILEWLVYTLPEDHLRSPRIELAIEFLLNTVARDPARDWPIGPRGHALRAMSLYSQRVFGAKPGQLGTYLAEQPAARNLR